jgi:hypothetical protein
MDQFVQSILVCALLVNTLAITFFVYKVLKIEDMLLKADRNFQVEMNCWQENFGEHDEKLVTISYDAGQAVDKISEAIEKIDSLANDSFDALVNRKPTPDVTTPIRPNNWDSMKKAFTGPSRVEVNERN